MGQPVNLTYSILLVIAALVSATVMVLTWHRRPGPGTVPLALLMLALTWWGLTYALHWSGFYRPTMFFWLDATYLGVVIVPVAFLAFALQFTNRDHWLNRRNTAPMALEPVLTLILLWTDDLHGLFFAGKRLADSGAILEGGPWFWINILYSSWSGIFGCRAAAASLPERAAPLSRAGGYGPDGCPASCVCQCPGPGKLKPIPEYGSHAIRFHPHRCFLRPGAALEDALARAENLHKREGFEPLHRTRWVKKIM